MKCMKKLFLFLLAALFSVGVEWVRAQSPQQSADPTKTVSNATKNSQPAAKKPPQKKTPASTAASPAAASQASPATAASAPAAAAPSNATSNSAPPPNATRVQKQTPPASSGRMVWVNTESGIYHKPGTRWYGKTKQGKYMAEADAIKAGYHAAVKE